MADRKSDWIGVLAEGLAHMIKYMIVSIPKNTGMEEMNICSESQ